MHSASFSTLNFIGAVERDDALEHLLLVDGWCRFGLYDEIYD